MARRGAPAKSARAKGASLRPTPVQSAVPSAAVSALNTPLSSAYPSTYPSEDEGEGKHYVRIGPDELSLEKLTLAEAETSTGKGKVPEKPFEFLSLPAELRLKIYGIYLEAAGAAAAGQFTGSLTSTAEAIDLDPDNYKRIHRRLLPLLSVCRTIFDEASPLFYGTNTFRVFPTHSYGRFSRTKKPLLARLSRRQRSCITTLQLLVGPSWNKPPRSWVVNKALGLADCIHVRRVKVFVTFDPGQPAFQGWRKSDGFYEEFCRNLLDGVLKDLPCVDEVEFDAFPSIKLSGELMQTLLGAAMARGKRVLFGPERGWKTMHDADDDDPVEEEEPAAVSAMDLMNGNAAVVVAAA